MKKLASTIAAIALVAFAVSIITVRAPAQTFAAGTMITKVLVVPNHATVAQTVAVTNNQMNRIWIPLAIGQCINPAAGRTDTNNVTSIAFRQSGASVAYRVKGVASQTATAESVASITDIPPLKYGDSWEITGSSVSNITYFVTHGVAILE